MGMDGLDGLEGLQGLNEDVLRLVIWHLSLWDSRNLAKACPSLAPLVSEETIGAIEAGLRAQRPEFLDAFATARPSFQERCRESFVLLRTPLDLTIQSCVDGVNVTATKRDKGGKGARVDVRVIDPARRPTLASLTSTIARVAWFSQVFDVREYRTRAVTHHPPSETLNSLVSRVVATRIQ